MWQTIGQSKILTLFERSLEAGDLAHAYLIVGAEHIGKMTLALDLARAVNCEGDKPPCSKCEPCSRIINGKHTDITIISVSTPSSQGEAKTRTEIGIDDIKDLQRSACLPPYEGKYKVFIIEDAEYLSGEAANCLLKTLEEPPPRVIILLLTANEIRLLPTVVSRCQRVELKPMSCAEIEEVLVGSYAVDSSRARLLSRLSQGCLGWALRALADADYLAKRTQALTEMCSLLSAGWTERFTYAAKVANDRRSAEEVIKIWLAWWRDIMLAKYGCEQGITNADYVAVLEKWAAELNLTEIRDFIDTLQKSLSHISLNANLRLVLEILMLEMPKKERWALGYTIPSMPVTV